jgi:Protein of unknown function (DUF2490)
MESFRKKSTFILKRLIPLLFIFGNGPIHAQTFDLGTWNVINLKYNQSKKTSFFAEAQLRSLKLYDQFHYYEYKAGINYGLSKSVKLTLGAGHYQTFDEGGNFKTPKKNDEFRIWPQIILLQQIGSATIEQRYRTEMRWTINGYRNRFRYRLGVSYPFGNDDKGYKPFLVSISNELFFTDREPYFERNRSQIALQYKTSKTSTIQLGYLHQFDYKINDETGRDFFLLGLYLEMNKSKKTSTVSDNEIRDN